MDGVKKISDISQMTKELEKFEYAEKIFVDNIDLGCGKVKINVETPNGLFYKILSDCTGLEIENESKLMSVMSELAAAKKKYDRFSYALHEVTETGYGVVSPCIDELSLEEPEIIKQGGRYGVRLRASAPSIHMIRNKPKSLEAA